MSLREVARQLGVSHTLLVLWKQGKRSLDPVLEARYHALVTMNGYENGYKTGSVTARSPQKYTGGPGRDRTCDQPVMSRSLYH